MSEQKEVQNIIGLNKAELWKIYRKSLFIRSCLNFERQQCVGFTNAMLPVIDKYYKGEERIDALQRHMQLFLTNPMTSAIPIGIACAMEERYATRKDIDKDSINAVKTALMGPLAALGDSIINGTIRPLVAGIAISFAMQGSILGPLLFLFIMGTISLGIRYFGIFKGYHKGVEIVDDIQKSGLITKLTEIASVAAFIIVGGFIPSVVTLVTKANYTSGDTIISVQKQLDNLMPGLLPLGITMLMYWMISKKHMSPILLMLLLMIIGIVGVYLDVL